MPIRTVLIVGLLLAFAGPVHAQTPEQVEGVARMLGWRPLGPAFAGGQVSDIAVVARDPSTFYVGGSGGLWKTSNGGTSFEPVFEGREGADGGAAVGAVAVAPSDPDVVWVGTGESRAEAVTPRGSGVYRSTDGGRSWTHVGLQETHHIGRILVDPRDAAVAYVAAVGDLWVPSPERGVYRTRDGGLSWERVLFLDELTGAVDLAMDPGNPDVLYAATYQRRRGPRGLEAGGPGSGVYRSTDGGESWSRLTQGWPSGAVGRIGLGIAGGDGRQVCAVVEVDVPRPTGPGDDTRGRAELYCSGGGAGRWERRAGLPADAARDGLVRIDPADAARIYVGARTLLGSTDRGATFAPAAGAPPPGADAATAGAYDGGGGSSAGAGGAAGGAGAGPAIAPRALWIDPLDPRHLLLGGDGGLAESRDRGEHWRRFGELPIAAVRRLSLDAERPYHVCGTLSAGGSWCAPSSTASTRGIGAGAWYSIPTPAGGPEAPPSVAQLLPASQEGLTAIAASPLDSATVYIGSGAGRLQVTRDGGATWTDVTGNFEGLPAPSRVTDIVASHADTGTVYAAFDARASGDFAPYVYESTSYGAEWRRIVGGLPASPVTALAQHAGNARLLFAGTSVGLWASLDGGGRWSSVNANLPSVPVTDVEVQDETNDVVIATRGRGIWIMDDAGPLAELTPRVLGSAAAMFPIGTATLPGTAAPESPYVGGYVAPNPPAGARIRYWIGAEIDGAELTVTDPLGEVLRVLDAPTRPGPHEVVWDLRLVEPDAEGSPMPPGPRVLPGVYLVRLTAGNEIIEAELMVSAPPGVTLNRGQLMARQQALLDAYHLAAPIRSAQSTLIHLDGLLGDVARLVAGERGARPGLTQLVDSLRGEVWALEREVDEASAATELMQDIERSFAPPTAGQLQALDLAWQEIPPLISRVNELVTTKIPALYQRLDEERIRPNPGAPVPLPRRGS